MISDDEWLLWLAMIIDLTPYSWALLEKPPVAQLIKNFPTIHGTRGFITCSQKPSIGPDPKPYYPILFIWDPF
jgi:hypothetical protein